MVNFFQANRHNIRTAFPPNSLVIDIGCGAGQDLDQIRKYGWIAVGLDLDLSAVRVCSSNGFMAIQARAEALPVKNNTADGLISNVTISYTNEFIALGEMARVLKPGGRLYISSHGIGYYLLYIFSPQSSFRQRIYGLRTVLNTWYYRCWQLRLPSFWGDTLYQSEKTLQKYCPIHGLKIIKTTIDRKFKLPIFMYNTVEKLNVL